MKRISLAPALVISAAALLHGAAYAGPFDDLFGAVLKAATEDVRGSTQQQFDAQPVAIMDDAQSDAHAASEAAKERDLLKDANNKAELLESNLRSGKVKPENINQAMTAFNATNGAGLASAPKIRPDGKMYAFYGIVEQAGENPEFLAYTSLGRDDHMRALLLGGTRNKTNYFKVKVPKAMQAAYFDNAKIGGGFDLVGRYVENISYKTVAGQEKSAPVFEAVYFVMW